MVSWLQNTISDDSYSKDYKKLYNSDLISDLQSKPVVSVVVHVRNQRLKDLKEWK